MGSKRNIILICCLILLMGCTGYRPDPVTKADVGRHAVYTVLHVIDWRQTREIAANPDRWHEHNLILGEHPSRDKVDLYFASTWLGITAGAWLLPRGWRDGLQYLGIVIEGAYVGHNYSIGLKGEW